MPVKKKRSPQQTKEDGAEPDVLTTLARAHTEQAFRAIVGALSDENGRIRLAAGELILTYGYGKPAGRTEAGDDLGALIREAYKEGSDR